MPATPTEVAPGSEGALERRAIVAAVIGALLGSLPVWLTGALAVQIGRDLDFGPARLGLASGAFFGAAAVGSVLMGRVAERIGATAGLRCAVLGSSVVLLGLGRVPTSIALIAGLVAAGAVNALSQVAANLLIARGVAPERQGWALAVKQAGVPGGTLLGGLAVPAFGVTVGWRWAYAAAALVGVVALFIVPGLGETRTRAGTARARADLALGPMVGLAVAVGFAAASNGTLATFVVSAGVDAGLGESAAGLVLTFGSAMGITIRLLAGRQADRRGGRHLPVVAALLTGGAVGYLLLAPGAVGTHLLGALVAFGSGWAWPGLFNLAVVRLNPSAPAAATGITQTGVYAGALAGPAAAGFIIDAHGFELAWVLAACSSLGAAAGIVLARRRVLAWRAATT